MTPGRREGPWNRLLRRRRNFTSKLLQNGRVQCGVVEVDGGRCRECKSCKRDIVCASLVGKCRYSVPANSQPLSQPPPTMRLFPSQKVPLGLSQECPHGCTERPT